VVHAAVDEAAIANAMSIRGEFSVLMNDAA